MPTPCTPALNHPFRLASSGETPPVGMMLAHGIGPLTPETKSGPPTDEPGKILTTSAPSSCALLISVTEPHPGLHAIFRRLQTLAISSSISGETIKLVPIWIYSEAVPWSITEPVSYTHLT